MSIRSTFASFLWASTLLVVLVPVVDAADLPRNITIGPADAPLTAQQNYADLWYLRRALAESGLPEDARAKATDLFSTAERDAQRLVQQQVQQPNDAGKLDSAAQERRAQFDKDATKLLTPNQIADISDHVTILFFEEMLVFNGGHSNTLLTETLPGLGIQLSQKQIDAIQKATQPDLEKMAKLMETRVTAPPAAPQPVVDFDKDEMSVSLTRVRQQTLAALAPEQRAKLDKWILDQFHQMSAAAKPATEPKPR